MMFVLALVLSIGAAFGLDDLVPMTRSSLAQMMQSAEKKRLTGEIVRDIYKTVIEEANGGKAHFAMEFVGCDNTNPSISEETCVAIVNDVFGIIQAKFPDCAVTYTAESKEFKIVWA